jgi:ABC-2 type transport system ATP-binding protein
MLMTENEAKQGGPNGTSTAMIEAIGLSKHYGNFLATENVSFSVPHGQIVAFLGPNGAGKSTTMKMLTGFLSPTTGSARIGGFDSQSERIKAAEILGYLPENGPLYNEMTPHDLLHYAGSVRGMASRFFKERFEYVVTSCSLESVLYKPIGKLSKGFRQRVGMAQAIIHDPKVLILDEPTSGLDPIQTAQARDLIKALGKDKTILLSTHILTEVQAVCARVILINQGRLIYDGAVSELSQNVEQLEDKFRTLILKSKT